MERKIGSSLGWYLVEIAVYIGLVTSYYFLVLHFLGAWLFHLFKTERRTYAAVALGLIIAQGFLLEALTRLLLGRIKPRRDAE